MDGFCLEWQGRLQEIQNSKVSTIYFGGGTPSLFGPAKIGEILSWFNEFSSEKMEITLETNPEDVDVDLMRAYADVGINRVSIGIQTLDDTLLKRIGRLHTADEAIESVYKTYEAEIHNISIDLLYDLPCQTLSIWESTLGRISELPIAHLSLYNLTVEPNTPFFKYKEKIQNAQPSEVASANMYKAAVSTLNQIGLKQYEISAFAKDNMFSRHNVGYWTGRPFLGFGPSAFSYWNGRRFRNVANLSRYYRALKNNSSPVDFEEELSHDEKKRELLTIHLRMLDGVDLKAFQDEHGALTPETITTIESLKQEEFMSQNNRHIRLTKKGILFYNHIASELIF